MLIRIVKLSIRYEDAESFRTLFAASKTRIIDFDGCHSVRLLEEKSKEENPVNQIFFTYSQWNNAESLDSYRNSPFFKEMWAKTKRLFHEKAQAWSVFENTEHTHKL